MIRLTIDNSYSLLQGFTTPQFKEIRELMSYNLPAQANYFSGGYRSPKRYLIDKRGNFPTGLLPLLKAYLTQNKISHTTSDRRVRPKAQEGTHKLSLGLDPHKWQLEATRACSERYRGIVSASTGTGKSIAMALLVDKLQLKTLIVVPNLTLKTQLIESFTQWFGKLKNITIENIDSPNLNKGVKYDVLIIDEAHHVAASTYRKLNKKAWAGIYHRFFFTATPFRSRDEENMLFESVAGQVIYRIGYHEAVESKYIVPVEAYYIEIPTTQLKGNPNSWPTVYSELVVNNKVRNLYLQNLLVKFHVNKVTTLCLVKEIKHGEILADDGAFPFVCGQDADSKDYIDLFNNEVAKTLVGTVGVLGEGVDTKPAEYVIIAGLGKSKNQFMQSVGRGIRRHKDKESCKVIILKDNSHKWTLAHYKAQVKILKEEYGIVPIRLDIV